MAGILRGTGRQALGALINFISYYVVGLPTGISLALAADMGTLGLYIGLLIGDSLQVRRHMLAHDSVIYCTLATSILVFSHK